MTNPYKNVKPVVGGSKSIGRAYHEIPGLQGPTYRSGTALRIDHFISHIPKNSCGLDIGCSVGGLSIELASRGHKMVGVDYDSEAINLGNSIAKRRNLDVSLIELDLSVLASWDFLLGLEFDFVVWLSQWMWLAKQTDTQTAKQRLFQISEISPTLIFETAISPKNSDAGSGGIESQEDLENLLRENTRYSKFENLGPSPENWLRGERPVFVCSE